MGYSCYVCCFCFCFFCFFLFIRCLLGGSVRGEVVITIDNVQWYDSSVVQCSRQPAQPLYIGITVARICWWGETGRGTLFRPAVCKGDEHANNNEDIHTRTGLSIDDQQLNIQHNTVCFPVHASAPQFGRYLRDARHLILELYHFPENDEEEIRRESRKSSLRSAWTTRKPQKQKNAVGKLCTNILYTLLFTLLHILVFMFVFVSVMFCHMRVCIYVFRSCYNRFNSLC